jgi:hypothetical protein
VAQRAVQLPLGSTVMALCMFVVLALGAGCSITSLPSQADPTCSWESDLPPNPDAVCRRTVAALQRVTRAAAQGNAAIIHEEVIDPVTARKIIAFSHKVRAEGVKHLHIVPSIALNMLPGGRIGAGFYVLGTLPQARLNSQETLYFAWVAGKYVVTASDLDKDW